MTLDALDRLFALGRFDHATYREIGSIWEGLYVYGKDSQGCRGFSLVGCFAKDSPDLRAAESRCRRTGISVGAYGHG